MIGHKYKQGHVRHIDHIISVLLGKTEIEIKKLNHYSNLKSFWAGDNLSKSKKYDGSLPDFFINSNSHEVNDPFDIKLSGTLDTTSLKKSL